MSPIEKIKQLERLAAVAQEHGNFLWAKFFRWLNRLLSDYANVQALGLWVAAILTGFSAVGYAKLFAYFEAIFLQIYETYGYAPCGACSIYFIGPQEEEKNIQTPSASTK